MGEEDGVEEEEEEDDYQEDDQEISKILFGNEIENSPLYRKEKHGRRGIKTPQKNIIKRLFKKEIEEGVAPRKDRVLTVQKEIGWPLTIPYKVMKTFVANLGRNNNKKKVGRTGTKVGRTGTKRGRKSRPKKFVEEYETDDDDGELA